MEAMRCLRRRLSDVACRQLVADAAAIPAPKAGPGGHSGATLLSSAADLTPVIGSSDQPLPGPALATLPPHHPEPRQAREQLPRSKAFRPGPLTTAAIEASHESASPVGGEMSAPGAFMSPDSPASAELGKAWRVAS